MASSLLQFLYLIYLLSTTFSFNLDTQHAAYMFGPPNSWFGFSLATHFRNNIPCLLVGAPRAESGQPGTHQAGALFSCDALLDISRRNGNCTRLFIEYPDESDAWKRPDRLHSKQLNAEGKNQQLLGFSVQSTGLKGKEGSRALVCAPLLRWGQNAYTDGVCYLLDEDLKHKGILNTCGPLPKKDRHNDYGTCEQGFSAYVDRNVILTGLPGARKWTGGIFAKYEFIGSGGFIDSVDRQTMEVDKAHGGVLALLASHDYLGYSVHYGRFGFSHEDQHNFTIVSGATRFNQTGAVVFLAFRRNFFAEEGPHLGLLEDHFTFSGQQLGSGFGSSLAVLDLNNDGFDDLLVGAPFEYFIDEEDNERGGAVYIFYSRGIKQEKFGPGASVFLEPIIIRGQSAHSHFGETIIGLGNLDNDPNGFEDFCVGAPRDDSGVGAIFVFHGAERVDFSTVPTQQISANHLLNSRKRLLTFGAALAKGIDVDGDGYAELAVGAPESDTVVMFRSRPVLEPLLGHRFGQKNVKIGDSQNKQECAFGISCFSLATSLFLLDRNHSTTQLLNRAFGPGQHPFICTLSVVPFARGVQSRALFSENQLSQISWPCGVNAVEREETSEHQLHIPYGNQDWTNPLRFNFSLAERPPQTTNAPWPAVNPVHKSHIFGINFDKLCGDDNECHSDLVLKGVLLDLSRRADGLYQAKVTEKDALVLSLFVENRAERAYLARLFLEYDESELDEPKLVKHGSNRPAVDIERQDHGKVVLALGNPLQADKKVGFDLHFKLVRGSSERISASLKFHAEVNSSSIEDNPLDNEWSAEVQLIKEADLQLAGVSRPPILHFSRGNALASHEMDIGPQLVHAYTLTNRGPFYARNVSLRIDWPLRLNLSVPNSDWLLYTLEEPLILQNGQLRRCATEFRLGAAVNVNPLGIYNDATLKLDYYQAKVPSRRMPRDVAISSEIENQRIVAEQEFAKSQIAHQTALRSDSVLLRNDILRPKWIREQSGERIRVVDINCRDGSAHCVQLTCHFDYIGSNDSALIEIRARFWNWTFSGEDFRQFDYISLASEGFIELDPAQGILEDISNNFARVITRAYPDRPQQDDHIAWWLFVLAALIGLVLLAILVHICRMLGFFKRKRPDLHLHQAHYKRQQEEEEEGK